MKYRLKYESRNYLYVKSLFCCLKYMVEASGKSISFSSRKVHRKAQRNVSDQTQQVKKDSIRPPARTSYRLWHKSSTISHLQYVLTIRTFQILSQILDRSVIFASDLVQKMATDSVLFRSAVKLSDLGVTWTSPLSLSTSLHHLFMARWFQF